VVQYRVPNGYTLIGDPPVCQPDSAWSTPPDCLSECELFFLVLQCFSCACIFIELCDENQNIPNAVVTVNRDIKSYTRKITCNAGYQPDGSDVQSCYRGTWTPIFNSCKRKSFLHKPSLTIVFTGRCSSVTLPNGSAITVLDNQFAVMECAEGFHLDPPLVLISCQEGMWTPSIPSCVPDQYKVMYTSVLHL